MKVEDLIEAAKSRTGLDDFGGDSFREGLVRLVASINSESRLTDLGRLAAPEMLIASLINRLEVEHWYRLHPETYSLCDTSISHISCARRSLYFPLHIQMWERNFVSPSPTFSCGRG